MKEFRKCHYCEKTNKETQIVNYQMKGIMVCPRHRSQLIKFKEIKTRTVKDPNEVVVHDDYAEVILYNRECVEIARAIIDIEDIDKIKDRKWCFSRGYVKTDIIIDGKRKALFLHRLINGTPADLFTDHINGNKLDNRKANLRSVTNQENTFNRHNSDNKTSGIIGVAWDKQQSKWQAYLHYNYKKKHLGYFENIDDAIAARKDAEIKYFGEYRKK